MTEYTNGPAPRPCTSCPYRRDVPSGIWAPTEYAKLIAYDADTALQPPNLFLCHQRAQDDEAARLCAGWVGCHGAELLALRLALHRGQVAAEVMEYTSPVPLFTSGAEAAIHGVRDHYAPGRRARTAIGKVAARRSDAVLDTEA